MAQRKREQIEANLAKLKSSTMEELRIAAAGPGEYASDARREISVRDAEAQKRAATKQASASWTTALATIGLVLLGLIAYFHA